MAFGIRLHAWGDYACFTRPELKAERVSYDVPTPSAARGLLEAVYWKPEIVWVVDRIHVLREIRFQSFRRNEVGGKISAGSATRAMRSGDLAGLGLDINTDRQQRAATILKDVAYVIEAHFELRRLHDADVAAKHASMFNRRAAAGQCFHRPCLGTREFPAEFALLPDGVPLPASSLPASQLDRELGWMLHGIDYADNNTSRFFRARLEGGILDVNRCLAESGTVA